MIAWTLAGVAALLSALSSAPAWAGGTDDLFRAMAVLRPAEPTLAPDLPFRTLDGREARLADLHGRPVLLGFFTTW